MSRGGAAMLDRLVAERYGGLVAYATVLTGDRHEAASGRSAMPTRTSG
ncbi:MAG: hypothetical protein J7503_14365 [Cellulomonas iranensis]|nr:hypothetical protein [Cellulomonas iranensis]MBO9569988.1 hypothetical protein [Cellulomonas iranensis]